MAKISELAEQALLKRQTLPGEFGADAVRPSYDGLGLVNVPALAVSWLAPDLPEPAQQPIMPPLAPDQLQVAEVSRAWAEWQGQAAINHVVILLMDALGYDQLNQAVREGVAPYLGEAINGPNSFFMPLTSVYPSTTTTALTTLATAYAPARHAIMGTWVYFREIGSVVNLIGFRPALAPTADSYLDSQLNPDTLLPVPNIYRRMEESGVDTAIVNYYQFKGSSISRFTSVGSRAGQQSYLGYLTPADGFAQLRARLEVAAASNRKSFTYAYVPTVDSAAHRYGPLTDSYRADLAGLDFSLHRELLAPLAGRSDVALLLVADHGQRHVIAGKTAWLNDHPRLTGWLSNPITGEGRVAYLHLKHGRQDQALAYIQEHLSEEFAGITKDQAIALGLFGVPGEPLGPECDDRIGDVLLVPRGEWVVRQHLTSDPRPVGYLGVHGGLSRSEMLIPFLAYRF